MKKGAILHLLGWDNKFVPQFREIIRENFPGGRHEFIFYGECPNEPGLVSVDTQVYPKLLKHFFSLSIRMNRAEKIILHGLFNNHLFYILSVQPWLLRKCYWVMWGGDLYVHEKPINNWRAKKDEFFRRFIIGRVGGLISQIKGDFELAKRWYGANGKYYECFMYPSNLYYDHKLAPKRSDSINIQVGNSADPSNCHIEVLNRLSFLKDQNVKIYAPLSYGDQSYAKKVVEHGQKIFGDKFVPMMTFIAFDQYLAFMSDIDIAIFNHQRQQAMGNITTLIGLGKKVYLRRGITSWRFLEDMGAVVFDIDNFDIKLQEDGVADRNKKIISNYFSMRNLLQQLRGVFQ